MLELLFWTLFLVLNCLNYVINYVFYKGESYFLPYISDFKKSRKPRIALSPNLDTFRYSVELSVFLIISRIYDLKAGALTLTILFLLTLIFNLYQYVIRRIYETEPVLFNDLKLIKNAVVIVWSESKIKVVASGLLTLLFFYTVFHFFDWFLKFNYGLSTNSFFLSLSFLWILGPVFSIIRLKGFYTRYPNDIYLRYHFVTVEILMNVIRSIKNYRLARTKMGQKYAAKRAEIDLGKVHTFPNIFFLFIESYGSFFFKEQSIRETSFSDLNRFQNNLKSKGYKFVSSFSKSTTTGGQSWLTYSSALFGHRIDNNTLFENYLRDEVFRNSNSLLRILKNYGYTNYNLNPINPINGINVPYKEMREMYAIDRWILSDDINYRGDAYGFGACAPDQYSLNFTIDLIKKEAKDPFTLFYLTKNSHSPFITPPIADDWTDLINGGSQLHILKGFLKYPEIKDYQNAIRYEYEVLGRFIEDHGSDNDVFILLGDHQPPMLAKPDIHGTSTPVHLVSKDQSFLDEFLAHGFKSDLAKVDSEIKHESLYSIFLNAFVNQYSNGFKNIPKYEPEGIKL